MQELVVDGFLSCIPHEVGNPASVSAFMTHMLPKIIAEISERSLRVKERGERKTAAYGRRRKIQIGANPEDRDDFDIEGLLSTDTGIGFYKEASRDAGPRSEPRWNNDYGEEGS
jgi:hypothetical protein